MGYTHYFRLNIKNEDNYFKAIEAIKRMVFKNKKDLKWDVKNREGIGFNGKRNSGYETCYFPLNPFAEASHFNCVKTARQPYDKFVVASFLILKHYCGEDVKLSSDGRIFESNPYEDSELKESVEIAEDIVGGRITEGPSSTVQSHSDLLNKLESSIKNNPNPDKETCELILLLRSKVKLDEDMEAISGKQKELENKLDNWWESLSLEAQQDYLKKHPGSDKIITAS